MGQGLALFLAGASFRQRWGLSLRFLCAGELWDRVKQVSEYYASCLQVLVFRLKFTLLSFFIAVLLVVSAANAHAEPVDRPYLILDYVQSILYRGERLALSIRVSNPTGAAHSLVVNCEVQQGDRLSGQIEQPVALGPGGERQMDLSLELPDVRTARAGCRLLLTEGKQEIGAVSFLITPPNQQMPKLRVQGAGLLADDGRYVVLQIEQRLWVEDRSWLLLRKFKRQTMQRKCAPQEMLLVSDILDGAAEGGYWGLVTKRLAPQGVGLVGVKRPEDCLNAPAMAAFADFSQLVGARPLKGAVIFLGTADQQVGTEPRLYGLVLEAMIQRLEAPGCSDVTIVLPIAPLPLRGEMQAYTQAALGVARAYKTKILDLPGKLGDSVWTVGSGGAAVYLSVPNADGQQRISEELVGSVSAQAEVK